MSTESTRGMPAAAPYSGWNIPESIIRHAIRTGLDLTATGGNTDYVSRNFGPDLQVWVVGFDGCTLDSLSETACLYFRKTDKDGSNLTQGCYSRDYSSARSAMSALSRMTEKEAAEFVGDYMRKSQYAEVG